MVLVRLYSNQPDFFKPIVFNTGLNIIIGKITDVDDKSKHAHNLGKSLIGKLIDFCLLKTSSDFLKTDPFFAKFIFFLEINYNDCFLTIKRGAKEKSKIHFFKSHSSNEDMSNKEVNWEEFKFSSAKRYLDSELSLDVIRPYDYRNIIGYIIRSQQDYTRENTFHLSKYRGSDSHWKPILAKLYGFDANLIEKKYLLENKLDIKNKELLVITNRFPDLDEKNLTSLSTEMLTVETEIGRKEKELESFNMLPSDQEKLSELISDVDNKIRQCLSDKYYTDGNLQIAIENNRKVKLDVELVNVKKLFEEAGVLFPESIKNSYEKLISFNKKITKEREMFIKKEIDRLQEEQEKINESLRELNSKRESIKKYIQSGSIDKFKELYIELSQLNGQLQVLKDKQEKLQELHKIEAEKTAIEQEIKDCVDDIRKNIDTIANDKQSIYSTLRLNFSELIKNTLSKNANLDVRLNKYDNIDFIQPEIVGDNRTTQEAEGTTYAKLLCIAFDMALVKTYKDINFPKFLFLDGAFDVISDPRVKNLLMKEFIRYSDLGVQLIITMLSNEIPGEYDNEAFLSKFITLELHDKGVDGLLFKHKF